MTEDEQSTTDSLATLFSGGILATAGKFFALILGFLTQIAMARLLTEAAYGDVVLTLAVISIVGLIAKLGLDDGVSREYPQHEDDPKKAYGIIKASFIIATVSGFIAGGILFFGAPILAVDILGNKSLIPLFRIGGLVIPSITLSEVAVFLPRGARDANVFVIVRQLFQPLIRFLSISVLLILGLGPLGAVLGQAVTMGLATILGIFLAYRSLPSFEVSPSPMYKSVLSFSIPLLAVQGMGFLNSNIDIYMVGYYLNSSMLGIYNIALQLGNLVSAVLTTTGFLLPPILTKLYKNNETETMRRMYQALIKWVLIGILPAVIVLFFAPELIIGLLFGTNYTPGITALRVLLVGKVTGIILGLNTGALIALGRNRTVSYIVAFQVIVNVILNITLIPLIGIEGAAISLTVSSIVGDILGTTLLYRGFRIHPFTKANLGFLSIVCIVVSFGFVLSLLFNLPTYSVVVLVGILYLPIVATIAIEPEDEKLLSEVEERTGYNLTIIRKVFRAAKSA
jgi:O-antigen/teichoic acid export membrane protein